MVLQEDEGSDQCWDLILGWYAGWTYWGIGGEAVQLHIEQELDIGKVVDRPKVQEPSELLSVYHNKVSVIHTMSN